jgi:type VI secretion system protein ImpG
MADDLLSYYERELSFLRQMGAEYAAKYPKIAARLQLEADKSEDPHVERLIQAAAFLAARVHHKLDDEYPEITEALLNVLYPHYLAPVPSMSIVQFVLDPNQGKPTSGYKIEKAARLYSQAVDGSPCRFRTCYPVTLWPLEVK